ncbi:MAG: hypothetical protein Q4C54_03065 [Clostridia bacterium]|nr:hypothetical protein [Clostridia bacterium]
MNESLFRKASLDRIASPEDSDEYLRRTPVPRWLIAAAAAVLLFGAACWGYTAYTALHPAPSITEGSTAE